VKDVCGLLSPFISLLFSKSPASDCYLAEFKKAVVRPLLKKHGLDAIQMKNYRPMSNLSFLLKLPERIVQSRLRTFWDGNCLMLTTQSAYRQYHSIETVVMMVYNDMLMAADGGQVSALCLLDLSAAFDNADVGHASVNKYVASVCAMCKLQRVLNAAARVVSDTRKYDRGLSHLLHDELHWLDVPQRVQYKLCAAVHRCLQHKAPQYMTDCCINTSVAVRRRAFSVAGPAAWKSLPDYLRDRSRSFDSFRRDLKTSFPVLLAYTAH